MKDDFRRRHKREKEREAAEPLELSAESTEDEAAMAVALRRSLFALVLLGVVAGGALWWLARKPSEAPTQVTPLKDPQTLSTELLARAPRVPFVEVTQEAGIDFRHYNGARGGKFLPETMGAGVAAFDFDGDGDADLLFPNGTDWPEATDGVQVRTQSTAELYRNDTVPGGSLRFTRVTLGSGWDFAHYGMAAACGDFDNDGRVDVLLTGVGGNRLLRNLGPDARGQPLFREVTGESGLNVETNDWSTAAAWLDMDNDGDLDLFIGNYVGWSPELDREVNNQLTGVGRAYGRPWNFPGTLPRLYRNDGANATGNSNAKVRFTEVGIGAGLQKRNPATGLPMAKTLAVAPIDLNGDGWMDLVVANDTVQNFVFTNRHDGTFREVGAALGVAFDSFGQARGAMGIDTARFRDDDPSLGIAIGNFANEMNALYVTSGRPDELIFADAAIAEGLGPASQLYLKFGLFFFDYDLDGRLDVLTANGHIDEEIGKIQTGVSYRQPAQLFWNAGGLGGRTFVSVGIQQAGEDLFRPVVGRGSAYADFDGDGDLDVVITQVNGPPMLFRNDQQLDHAWLRLRLIGTRSNRDAIGAWIVVRSGSRTLHRQVMPTKSYLSQSELPVTIGLGPGGKVDSVTITWPGGRVQQLGSVALGRETTVRETE